VTAGSLTFEERAEIVARFDSWTKKVADDFTRSVNGDGFDDLVNEGRIAIWRSLERFDPDLGHVASWVTRAARTRMVSFHFGKGREFGHTPLRGSREVERSFVLDAVEDHGTDPLTSRAAMPSHEDDVIRRKDVADALLGLTEKDREILRLRFWEDLTWEEVAARVGGHRPEVAARYRDTILPRLRKSLLAYSGAAA
jgi:RNA polymerase sigma factor (sigma-70 family)